MCKNAVFRGVLERKARRVSLVLPAGHVFKEHKVSGLITVHCIDGQVVFSAMGATRNLKPGQLLDLNPGELHSLNALFNSVLLLTIVL